MRYFAALFCIFMLGVIGLITAIVCANVPGGTAEHIVPFLGLAALPFLVLLLRAMWSFADGGKSAVRDDNVDEAIRELMRVQDRMEQRITNLETILLSRTHTGVPKD